MKKCPSCATENENHFKYCSNCGSRFRARRRRPKRSTKKIDKNEEAFKSIEEIRAGSFLLRNYKPLFHIFIALATSLFLLFFYLIISYSLTFEDIIRYRHFDRGLLVISLTFVTFLVTIFGGMAYHIYCTKKIEPDSNILESAIIYLFPLLFSPLPIGGLLVPLLLSFFCLYPDKKSKQKSVSEKSPIELYLQKYSVNLLNLAAAIMIFIALAQGAITLDIFFGNKIAEQLNLKTTIEWNGRLPLDQKQYRIVIRDHKFEPNRELVISGSCELIFENTIFSEDSSIIAYGNAKVTIKGGKLHKTRVWGGDDSSLFIDEAELEDSKVEADHNALLTLQNSKLINSRLEFSGHSSASLNSLQMFNGILDLSDSAKVSVDGLECEERGVMYKDRDLFDKAMVQLEDSSQLNAVRMYITGQQREALICKDESRITIEKGVAHSPGESIIGSRKAIIMLKDFQVTNSLLKDNSILALEGSKSYQVRVKHSAYFIYKNSELMRKTWKGNYYEGRILKVNDGESPFELAEKVRAGELL